MRIKMMIIVAPALLVSGCVTERSGHTTIARGFSPAFVENVAKVGEMLHPEPECKGGDRLTQAEADVRYQSNSNGLRGQGAGAPGRPTRQLTERERSRLLQRQGEDHFIRLTKQSQCVNFGF